jgi:antagonist of KipI
MADRPLPETEAALISQPVVTGAIQLPPGGSPLLLMADRQTTGGYEIVAAVIAADLPLAGQLGPGDACTLVPCGWDQAAVASVHRERELDASAPRNA